MFAITPCQFDTMTDDRIWCNDSETDALKTLLKQRAATVTQEIRGAAEVQLIEWQLHDLFRAICFAVLERELCAVKRQRANPTSMSSAVR